MKKILIISSSLFTIRLKTCDELYFCLESLILIWILFFIFSSRSLALPSFQFWSSPQTIQEPFCSSLTFLTAEQRAYCQNNPKIFSIITRSLRLAIEECQYQFRNQRWNCSIFNQSEIFGKLSMRSKQSEVKAKKKRNESLWLWIDYDDVRWLENDRLLFRHEDNRYKTE